MQTSQSFRQFLLLGLSVLCLTASTASAQVTYLTNQHMDLRLQFHPAATGTNQLNVVLGYDSPGGLVIASNHQFYVVGTTNARRTVPANPDFAFLGPAGAPVWILPKTQDILRPYLGVSAEDISSSDFDNPTRLELVAVDGPGTFFAYDVIGSTPTIKMAGTNSGVSSTQHTIETLVGSHGHYNWAFTTNGLYRLTFRAVGSPAGTGTNLIGRDVTMAFQILPLRPWENWISTNWLPATGTNLTGPTADPDGDSIQNVMEYALHLDPNTPNATGLPRASLVTTNGLTFGALTYTRVKAATDLVYEPSARGTISGGNWSVITNVVSIIDQGETESITVRDDNPISDHTQRFFQLRIKLNYP